MYFEENLSMLPICHPFPHLCLNSARMNPFVSAYLSCLEGTLYEEYIRSWEDKTTYLPTSESGPVMLVASAAAAIVIPPGDSTGFDGTASPGTEENETAPWNCYKELSSASFSSFSAFSFNLYISITSICPHPVSKFRAGVLAPPL